MLDAFDLEVSGRPTITICHAPFERAARSHAAAIGLIDLPLLVEPAPKGSSVTVEPRTVALGGIDRVVASLTRR